MNSTENLVNTKTTIVDVREPMEFAMGHIPGAINVPLSTLPTKVGYFRNLNGPAVLYCRSGKRSGQAVSYLNGHGIYRLFNGGSIASMETLLSQATKK